MINNLKDLLRRTPSLLLLFLVFLVLIPRHLSYDHAWVQPEQVYIKMGILKEGPAFNFQDFKKGLFWQLFEYQPRSTRPLSSYFEVLDTKFRYWLWHYIMPHPSLSLTWIFSLILSPLLLYFLLRNFYVGANIALLMVSFYLMTPGVLSCETMLFRPGKPMTNFAIILCLYLASRLQKYYINKDQNIPWKDYLLFWLISSISLFWDETALLIFPAILVFFPKILKKPSFLLLWLSLPLIVALFYFKIIPQLSFWAGYPFPHLDKYDKIFLIGKWHILNDFYKYFLINTKNLIFDTLGLIPFSSQTPFLIKACTVLTGIAWGIVGYYIFKLKKKFNLEVLFLIFLTLFFNYLVVITMSTWGPYYYGAFWSVFFVIFLAKLLQRTLIPKYLLCLCFLIIFLNMSHSFIAINHVYKKYHFYPYNPGMIELYFQDKNAWYNPNDQSPLSGRQLKSDIYLYWLQVRIGAATRPFSLPKELCWLPTELEPEKKNERYSLLSGNPINNHDFIIVK